MYLVQKLPTINDTSLILTSLHSNNSSHYGVFFVSCIVIAEYFRVSKISFFLNHGGLKLLGTRVNALELCYNKTSSIHALNVNNTSIIAADSQQTEKDLF